MSKENGKAGALTTQDVIELSASLMSCMPEPDSDGVFDDEELDAWESQMRFVCSSAADKLMLFRMIADRLANEASFVRSQEDVLVSRRKGVERKRLGVIERMKSLLVATEHMTGTPKVVTSDSSWVGIRRTVKKVVRVPEGLELPEHFLRVKSAPDKSALMDCYKETPGLLPEGVTVEESHSESVMWPGKVK